MLALSVVGRTKFPRVASSLMMETKQINTYDEEDTGILPNKNKFKSIYVSKCRGLVEPEERIMSSKE